jgi:toxin ParE1/3/4
MITLKWILSKEAQADMCAIRFFSKQQWGEIQSSRYIKEIQAKIELLTQNPRMGIDRSDDVEKGIRSICVGSHTIYYEFNTKTVIVRAI